MNNSIDITPSPRILRMLGQIDFSALQCLCELIDNSIDAFANVVSGSIVSPEIIVKLPRQNSMMADKVIEISDNGPGMSIDQLNRSLQAGFSGNNPIDKMGLFGMGFNIATARLGQKTEIITCRKEDDHFHKVTIDFRVLEDTNKFYVPIEKIQKEADEVTKQGTTIRISNLNLEHIKPLKQKTKISRELGKTYGRILRTDNIRLIYDGTTCKPFQHCIWSEFRTGRNGTPAIIQIDKVIDSKRYCTSCWTWLIDTDATCPSCGESGDLTTRERRVKGWIGLQRFFDSEHYGFDLIRNGRVIRPLDKELFYWTSDDDEREIEYPVDGFQTMGRFVGELEIDFVQVTHQKDAFEKRSADWRDFVSVVRGAGPIRTQVAKRNNYSENTSPLATLFSAFRTSKAGKENLVPAKPGTTSAMLRDSIIQEYTNNFFNNEHDYFDDTKWWDLILRGEKKEPSSGLDGNGVPSDDPTGGNIFGAIEELEPITIVPPIEEIPDENSGLEQDENLSGPYSIDIFKNTKVKVDAYKAQNGTHPNGFRVTIHGALLTFEYWPNSKIFEETFLRPEDLLVNELAYFFFLTAEERLEDTPLSVVERSIKKRYFPDLHPEIDHINDEIRNLSREMKSHMRAAIKKVTDFKYKDLSVASIAKIRRQMSHGDLKSEKDMDDALQKGEFINYADLTVLIEIFKRYPHTLFDGEFFIRKISDIRSLDEVDESLINDAIMMFTDLAWWQDNGKPSSSGVWKGRSRRVVGSLEVVRGWRT